MRIENVMTTDVVTCDADAPVEDAARQMNEKGIGALVVLRDGRLAGLLTDRQIALKVVGEGRDASRTSVSDIMTVNPACLSPDDSIFAAVDTMRGAGSARRIPIVDEAEQVVGIVSLSDLAPIARDLFEAFMLEERPTLKKSRPKTGGKRIAGKIRRPTRRTAAPRRTART